MLCGNAYEPCYRNKQNQHATMEKQHKYLKCVKFLIQPKEIKKYL